MSDVVLCNPAAGGGRAKGLARRVPGELRLTGSPGQAGTLARMALAAGARRIAVVGGDGTVHEAVQGLLADGPPPADLVLTVYPGGTSCDFARSLDPAREQRRDLIAFECADGARRYAVNGVSVGFLADATALFRRGPRLVGAARRLGPDAAQVVAGLATVARGRSTLVELRLDGGPVLAHRLSGLTLYKTATIGGSMRFGVRTGADDGRAVLFRTRSAGRATLLAMVAASLLPGGVAASRTVTWRRLQRLELAAERPLAVEADGEMHGTTPLRCTVVPRALRVRLGSLG